MGGGIHWNTQEVRGGRHCAHWIQRVLPFFVTLNEDHGLAQRLANLMASRVSSDSSFAQWPFFGLRKNFYVDRHVMYAHHMRIQILL